MKIKQILALIIILVILGGCQLKEAKLPETKAFQDEFTREFMDSTEEVRDGYYLFRSKTDRYTMLFPKNAEIDSGAFYERNKDHFESLSFVDYSKEENYSYTYDVTYTPFGEDALENSLEILSEKVGYGGDYKEIEEKNTRIFFAKEEKLYEADDRQMKVYGYYSYIIPKEGNVGVEFIYSADCYVEKKCSIDPGKEEEKAIMLMKSVHFKAEE
ncbi:hypothetical protein [Aquibacillus rhizosphaerae]|uniref:Lipoprotein YvcA n=1 Tax=Aquibacillus rhizosphaerae TaxID=3051431 RepID=A0ABT7L9U3_9BACI|nr:hypothetical protein [Aquibacillus sp. LR5S19]MDL4842638.1 hypothetical protein [Aquibacillus sp. LR5S19]